MWHKSSQKQSPSWWLLYFILPIMIGLLLIEIHLPLSGNGHRLAELLILLVIWGCISSWLKANRAALTYEDLESSQKVASADMSAIPSQPLKAVRLKQNLNPRPRRVR